VQVGDLQVGQVIAFINYLTQALMSLTMVSMLVMRVARAEASAARIEEVLESAPQVPDHSANGARRGLRRRCAGASLSSRCASQLQRRRGGRRGAQGDQLCGGAGRDGRPARRHRLRQIEPDQPHPSLLRRERVVASPSTVWMCATWTKPRCAGRRRCSAGAILFSGTIRDNIRFGAPTPVTMR
jgi:ABC-type multidrug transport system fused ATPase/permease subunit